MKLIEQSKNPAIQEALSMLEPIATIYEVMGYPLYCFCSNKSIVISLYEDCYPGYSIVKRIDPDTITEELKKYRMYFLYIDNEKESRNQIKQEELPIYFSQIIKSYAAECHDG